MIKKIVVIVIVTVASAQSALAFHVPLLPCRGTECTVQDFITFVRNIITTLLEIAIPLAVIFIVYGAFVIMTAGGSEEKVKKGKTVIISSVIGLTIALASWLIVTTINQALKGLF